MIVGLKNGLEFLGSEFSKTITDFQNFVGETSATAVLAEETLDDAVKKLNEADEKHKVMDTNFKSIYDGISSLYRLSAPLSSTFYTNTQTARKYVQDTKNKVNAFDKMTTTSSTEQLFSALGSQMAAAGRVKSLSYSDPILTDFVAHEDLGKAIYEMDQQYAKAKAEAIEAAKRKAEQEAAEREASYRRHHPIQAWLKDRSNEIGSWWGDVVEGTRNLPLPQGIKDSLLFAEGFIGAAGSMVSETAIGAVDLTQIIGIASIDGVNRLTGGQTPEWMKRDLQGTADNLSSLAELGVGTYTALTDPGAAQRGQDPNASYADKAAYRAQETGKALWDKVTHMDAYDAGGLTFEIASLFVGPAAVGKMAKGTKLGAKAAEMIQLAKNSTKARILANVEKWGSKVDNILAKSNNVIGKFGEKLLDTRIPVGIRKEAVAFAGGMRTMPTFSVESKTLRDVMHFSSKHADDAVRVAEKPFDKERILENLRQSRLARESSKFGEYLRKENQIKYPTGIDGSVKIIEKADLPSWIVDSFQDGQYRTVVTTEEVTVYRTFGGHSDAGGGFVTSSPAQNRIQAKIDTALLPEWKNTRMYEVEIRIPKGETLSIGKVAPQKISLSGTVLKGGADQILLPQDWPLEWISDFRIVPN